MYALRACLLTLLLCVRDVSGFGSRFGWGAPPVTRDLAVNASAASANWHPVARDYTRVALFGDQGLGENAAAVLRMIKSWQADLAVHLGDFDYADSPPAFAKLITDNLGINFPYVGLVGNHDLKAWTQYQQDLAARLDRADLSDHCRGEYGVYHVCRFENIVLVLVGVGTQGRKHAEFIDEALRQNADATFKICGWHKNQRAYQTGNKRDETGYEVYDVCRQHGAMIATGHEHSYSRTRLMQSFEDHEVVPSHPVEAMSVEPGKSFAFVAGTAGAPLRGWKDNLENNPWWALTASTTNGLQFGAVLCEFPRENFTKDARCEYRDINGKVWDNFVVSALSYNASAIPPGTHGGHKRRAHTLDVAASNVEIFDNDSGHARAAGPRARILMSRDDMTRQFSADGPSTDSPSNAVVVTFHDVRIDNDATVKKANLQFYVLDGEPEEDVHLDIEMVAGQHVQTVRQIVPAGDIERNEVWSTRDLGSFMSASRNETTFTFALRGLAGQNVIVAGMDNAKLAPSLFIQLQ